MAKTDYPKKEEQNKKTKKKKSASAVSLSETTPIPSSPQAQPQKKSSVLQKSISILAFLVGFFVVGYLLSNSNNGFSGTGVHITGLTYHYYNPETGLKWTYSLPNGFNMGVGTTTNITTPFTSNLTCSMTFSQAYATTQGFTFFIHNLPVTFEPNQPGSYTVTITAPSYQYSGPLDVNMTVTYGYGC